MIYKVWFKANLTNYCRYDDADILAGQGTVGVEVHEQMYSMGEPVDAIVVPVGGGGLIAGISVAMKHLSPDTEVIVSILVLETMQEIAPL